MKIRSDFVTNSSSVSYIVTMNVAMAEFVRLKNENYSQQPQLAKVFKTLTGDMRARGTKIQQDGVDLVIAKYDFEKKVDCIYDASLMDGQGAIDFSKLNEKQLWGYIYGEYFVRGRLSSELKGLGATQVPRDKEKLVQKTRALFDKDNPEAVCEVCGNCPPDRRKHHAGTQA